ncbi:MFS general substrate transporter [Aspergillus keveii]|uniref:MFS general substrate transporter n=1 Tax=Aspergillus keveii TaxID=714993 RepID=A0ABR4G1K8_9EURO
MATLVPEIDPCKATPRILTAEPSKEEAITANNDTPLHLIEAHAGSEDLDQDHSQYPDRLPKLVLAIIALVVIQTLQGLDTTIVSTAIPKITDQFHALGDIGWYPSSYILTFCSFQLIWGKLYTFYAAKWTYLVALFVFELGSFLCGIAPSSTGFIVGRAIAGLGGGGTAAGSLVLVTHLLPPPRRPPLIGVLCATFGCGAAIGPLLGGAITDNPAMTWRWCFYINLPLGAAAAAIVVVFIPRNKPPGLGTPFRDRLLQMDLLGAVLLIPGIVCLLLALQWGGTQYPWSDGRIIGLLVVALVLGTSFILTQICRKDEERVMLPPRLIKDPRVWTSTILGASASGSFFVVLYNLPIWFQAVKGASAAGSGLMNLPLTISFLVASTLGGMLSSGNSSASASTSPAPSPAPSRSPYPAPCSRPGRSNQRFLPTCVRRLKPPSGTTVLALLTLSSPILSSSGSGLLSTLSPQSSTAKWIGYQILVGAGAGLGMQLSLTGVQSMARHSDITMGTTIILLCQNLTVTVLTSVAATVLNLQLHARLRADVPGLPGGAGAVTGAGATGFRGIVPHELIPDVLEVYNGAVTRTFLVAVGAACFGIGGILWVPLTWRRARAANEALSSG